LRLGARAYRADRDRRIVVMIVGAALGPETREVELHLPGLGLPRHPVPVRVVTPRSA
jgi:hypothetical protein